MISRRTFLAGAAATAGVVAAGGAAGVAFARPSEGDDGAAAAWAASTGVDRLLLAATLAPSSHNTQPWRFRSSSEGIEVLGDSRRTMGAADPRLRELHVSMGCALENAAIAAADAGTPVAVELAPGSAPDHFARLRFTADGESLGHRRLARAIPSRRTNRGPYDVERAVPARMLGLLGALAEEGVRVVWLTESEDRERFTELSVKATAAHVAQADMQRDSHRWYRMDADDAERYRDGITVRGANLPPIVALFMGVFPPTPESFDAGWDKATSETHCGTARAFGLLVAERASDHRAWTAAGRAFMRMQLAGQLEGLSLHPISQALALRDREVASGAPGRFSAGLEALAGSGEVVLAFRLGYPQREQPASLRRPPVVVS